MRALHAIEKDICTYYLSYDPAARYYFGRLLNELAEYKPTDKSLLDHLAEVLEDESVYRKGPMVTRARAWAKLPDLPAVKAMRQSRGYAVARLTYEDQQYAIDYANRMLAGEATWSMFDADVLGKVPLEEREDSCVCERCGKVHVRKADK